MKKLITLFFVMLPFFCMGQQNAPLHKNNPAEDISKRIENQVPSQSETFWLNYGHNRYKSILVVLNGVPLDNVSVDDFDLDIEDITKFWVLKGNEAIEQFGELGREGVVLINTLSKVKYDRLVAKNGIRQTNQYEATVEYEATVIAPGFDSFVATQPSKAFFTESSLKSKNALMAAEWNARYRNPRQHDAKIYEAEVDYDRNTEYGMDVEYTLYMFFRFMEKEHNMSLIGDRLTARR